MQGALSSTDADMYLNSTLSTYIPNWDENDTINTSLNSTLSTYIPNWDENDTINTSLAYSIDTWIWYICPPFILIFGTFGNIMILVAYRGLRSTTISMFMRALAITDLFLLYIVMFIQWISYILNVELHTLHDVTCKLYYFSVYAFGDFSAWLTASMTVQRAVSVVWPHRSGLMCTQTKTLYLFIGMLCCVLAVNAHVLYGFGVVNKPDSEFYSCNSVTDKYNSFFVLAWPWVDLLCSSLIPFVLIVISNCVLVWKMKTSMNSNILESDQSVSCEHREKRNGTVTRTLIVISIVFLILTLPCNILIITYNYDFAARNIREFEDVFNLFFNVTLLLWYSNSAVNFYIYYACGTVFRTEVKRLLCGCSHQSAQTQSTQITQSATSVQDQNTRF